MRTTNRTATDVSKTSFTTLKKFIGAATVTTPIQFKLCDSSREVFLRPPPSAMNRKWDSASTKGSPITDAFTGFCFWWPGAYKCPTLPFVHVRACVSASVRTCIHIFSDIWKCVCSYLRRCVCAWIWTHIPSLNVSTITPEAPKTFAGHRRDQKIFSSNGRVSALSFLWAGQSYRKLAAVIGGTL